MSERYVNVDRETALLLPVDMREWVAGDDLMHFVLEAVAGTALTGVRLRTHGGGSPAYPPGMMMGLLIYCYAHGMVSSRQIERASYGQVSVRYLCGNLHPDHDTICAFRRENRELIKAVFGQVLKLAGTMGLLQVGTICVDGTKILVSAARRRTLEAGQVEQIEQRVQTQINDLLAQAEQADRSGESASGGLPEELASRERLRAKMGQARALLKQMAEERAAERTEERAQWEKNPIGEAPRSRSAQVRPQDRVNLTDPQSALQPLARGGYAPGYNAQLAVSGTGCTLVVATEVRRQTNDRGQLLSMARAVQAAVPAVREVVFDTGYDHARQSEQAERTLGVEVYCALQESPERAAEAAPAKRRVSQPRQRARDQRARMRQRVGSARGQELLARRSRTVEPTFGMIKSVLGFRRFSLRGLEKVKTEWALVALAFNCRRLAPHYRR